MKKTILAVIAGIIAAVFTSCTPQPTADVKWKSEFTPSSEIAAITWENTEGVADTIWSNEQLKDTSQETSFREVTELAGQGSCIDSGVESQIIFSGASSGGVHTTDGSTGATFDEDAQVTLVIKDTTPSVPK